VSNQIPHDHLHQAGNPAVNDAACRTAALGYLLVSRRSASEPDPEAVRFTPHSVALPVSTAVCQEQNPHTNLEGTTEQYE